MDAVIENVRSFVGVRKSNQVGYRKPAATAQNVRNKVVSKIFGISLSDLCSSEGSDVPFIVRDICTFIEANYLQSEGIFRLSSPSAQITKLKEAFEQNCNYQDLNVCLRSSVDGHTAANVLKQFLRNLPQSLIPEEVLHIFRESKCLSDETFAASVRSAMNGWQVPNRSTLQYLLSFLQQVMQNSHNRMNVTGLAVVFGPNVFRISTGVEGLSEQTTANQTFERLLITSDIICEAHIDDQGYLKMASPTSGPAKPARPAPPIPLEARPLPPPPVPQHGSSYNFSSPSEPPLVLPRSHNHSYASGDGESDFMSTSEDCTIDESQDPRMEEETTKVFDRTVRHVVRKHLFNQESSSSSCADDTDVFHNNNRDGDSNLLPSLTAGRIAGPSNRRKPSRKHSDSNDSSNRLNPKVAKTVKEEEICPVPAQRRKMEVKSERELITNEPLHPASSNTVTTPDSGCLTAEDDLVSRRVPPNDSELFIPKLNLQEAIEDVNCDATDVPRLDLSEVTQVDELTQPKPVPRHHKPSKTKKKKRKGSKASPNTNSSSNNKMTSEPIKIPEPKKTLEFPDDELSSDFSPKDTSSSRWRDAWSTDDEAGSPVGVMENNIHTRYAQYVSDNMEVAPSSPIENHVYPRSHHMHHTHGHHHHHSHLHHNHHHNNSNLKHNHANYSNLSRPKIINTIHVDENVENLQQSLAEMVLKLEGSRKDSGRPEDLTLMTREQIRNEKIAMQKELLRFEGMHGRPSTKKEKEIMRDIYNRYRMVKRLQMDTMSPPFHSVVSRRLEDYDDYKDEKHTSKNDTLNEEFTVTQLTLQPVLDDQNSDSDHVPADLGIEELRRQQKEARGQRKRLRRKLRDFENEIQQQYDRQVMQADRIVMATEYGDYKDLKAKLRLLDALIEKHNSQLRS
nr:protein FAM13A [Ciona intestinalis]|eukprot:XP_002126326.1 protein FAM13A [Ciona intestinalis]